MAVNLNGVLDKGIIVATVVEVMCFSPSFDIKTYLLTLLSLFLIS